MTDKCMHVARDELVATATVTLELDVDGPVKHNLEPVRVRVCPRCAGGIHGRLLRMQGPPSDALPLQQLEATARELGYVIGDKVPNGVGFLLVLFEYSGNLNLTYLSSGQRPSVITMLKQLLEKLQRGTN